MRLIGPDDSVDLDQSDLGFDICGRGSGPDATVTAGSANWSVRSDSSWLTVTINGSAATGANTITYSVALNSGQARTGVITVESGNTTATLVVSQLGVTATISFNPASVTGIAAAGQSGLTTTVTAATSWTATSSDSSWLTITSGGSGAAGTSTLTYAVATNSGQTTRTAVITATAGSATATLNVSQNAGTQAQLVFTFAPNPVHPAATNGCGITTPPIVWVFKLTIKNSGTSTFTPVQWFFNDVWPNFGPDSFTETAADFLSFFGSSNIPPNVAVSATVCIQAPSKDSSGTETLTFVGSDGSDATTPVLTMLSTEPLPETDLFLAPRSIERLRPRR